MTKHNVADIHSCYGRKCYTHLLSLTFIEDVTHFTLSRIVRTDTAQYRHITSTFFFLLLLYFSLNLVIYESVSVCWFQHATFYFLHFFYPPYTTLFACTYVCALVKVKWWNYVTRTRINRDRESHTDKMMFCFGGQGKYTHCYYVIFVFRLWRGLSVESIV